MAAISQYSERERVWLEIFADPVGRRIMENRELIPRFKPNHGWMYEIEGIDTNRETGRKVDNYTKRLSETGFYQIGTKIGSIHYCSSCESHAFSVQPICPTCKSNNINEDVIFQHTTHGATYKLSQVSGEKSFLPEGIKTICLGPECKKEISIPYISGQKSKDGTVLLGTIWNCEECSKKESNVRGLEKPLEKLVCLECSTEYISAVLPRKEFYSFAITPEGLGFLTRQTEEDPLAVIKQYFDREHLSYELMYREKTEMGMELGFDMKIGDVAIQTARSREVNERVVYTLAAAMATSIKKIIFYSPSESDDHRMLALRKDKIKPFKGPLDEKVLEQIKAELGI